MKKFLVRLLLVVVSFTVVSLTCLLAGVIFWAKSERPREAKLTSHLFNASYSARAQTANVWLETLYKNYLVPSLSVAVSHNGEMVWQGVMGYADIRKEKLADVTTVYRIGSISKPMTAVVALKLQEQGKLDINKKFMDYVPDYAAGHVQSHSAITIKHLLSHQAGVRHYIDQLWENYNFTEYADTRAAAAIVEADPLAFEPGKGFLYTTYGYTLLSLALETAAEKSFENVLRDELITPLQLTDTSLNKASRAHPQLARSYLEFADSLYLSPEPNVSNKYAGGGLLSTPSDLVKFGNALLNDSLLKSESRELLWAPVALANGQMNPDNYALGFRVGSDQIGRFVYHGGTSIGGQSFLLIYPEAKLVIALAANASPSSKSFNRLKEAQKLARDFISQEK